MQCGQNLHFNEMQCVCSMVLKLYLQTWLRDLESSHVVHEVHNLLPQNFSFPDHFLPNSALTVPRTHNRFGDRSFAVAGPRLWNSLPISLQQISSYHRSRIRYLSKKKFANFNEFSEIKFEFDVFHGFMLIKI